MRRTWILIAAVVLVFGALSVAFWPKLVSRFYVQVGAIELSKGQAALQTNAEQGEKHLRLAESYYQRALGWDGSDTSIYVKLGIVYLAEGQVQPALDYLTRAKELRPGDRLASLWLGAAYSRSGRTQLAAEMFRDAGAFGQLILLGNQYAGLDDYDNAASVFRAAVSVRPDYAWTYRKLGEMEEERGNNNGAIVAYSTFVTLEKVDSIQKYLVEAHVADMQKRWADAVAAYEKAFELASQAPKTPSPGSGLPAQQEAKDVRDNPDLHFRLGVDYGELGRREDSLRELREAVRLGGTSKWHYRALADAYFDKGDFQSSLTWYRKVLEVDPTDWRATERMQALAAAW